MNAASNCIKRTRFVRVAAVFTCPAKCQIRFEEALELQQRLVIKKNVIQVLSMNPGLAQAIIRSALGEIEVVFLACETQNVYFSLDHARRARVNQDYRLGGFLYLFSPSFRASRYLN